MTVLNNGTHHNEMYGINNELLVVRVCSIREFREKEINLVLSIKRAAFVYSCRSSLVTLPVICSIRFFLSKNENLHENW